VYTECADEIGTQQPIIHVYIAEIHNVYTWNVLSFRVTLLEHRIYQISIIIIENNFAGVHISFRIPT
jgi:hypothetical protein